MTMKKRINSTWNTLKQLDSRIVLSLRDFVSLKKEKTIVLALLVQLIIAGFSSFLVVGIVALYDTESGGQVHTIGITGEEKEIIESKLIGGDTFDVFRYEEISDGRDAIQGGDINALLVTDRDDNGVYSVNIILPENDLQSPLIINDLQKELEELERTERVENSDELNTTLIEYPAESETNDDPYYTFTYTILIPLLVFLPVFISGSVAVDSLSEEIEQGTLEMLLTTPITIDDILTSKIAVATLLGPLQAIIWISLLTINGITISHPIMMLIFVTGLTLILVSLGIGVSVLSPNRQYAQGVYSVLILAFFSIATLLPEHTGNTAAKLAAGSASSTTMVVSVLYVCIGIVTAFVVKRISKQKLKM